MAQAIGANLIDIEQIQAHPTVEQSTATLVTEGVRGAGGILLNAEGSTGPRSPDTESADTAESGAGEERPGRVVRRGSGSKARSGSPVIAFRGSRVSGCESRWYHGHPSFIRGTDVFWVPRSGP